MTPELRIESPAETGTARVTIGDLDISDLVTNLTIYISATGAPMAMLAVPVGSLAVSGANPRLNARTAAALTALGWTRDDRP